MPTPRRLIPPLLLLLLPAPALPLPLVGVLSTACIAFASYRISKPLAPSTLSLSSAISRKAPTLSRSVDSPIVSLPNAIRSSPRSLAPQTTQPPLASLAAQHHRRIQVAVNPVLAVVPSPSAAATAAVAASTLPASHSRARSSVEAMQKYGVNPVESSSFAIQSRLPVPSSTTFVCLAPTRNPSHSPSRTAMWYSLASTIRGGTEEIYRCVKMRVELNRGWQREANQFNVNAFRQLRALQGTPLSPPTDDKGKAASAALPTNRQSVSVTDCCICLFSVTVCQALFIAPCSHVFHYKCIRPLLNLHHPGFSCPLCRTFADLDADVEEDEAWQEALMHEAQAAEASLAQGKQPLEVGTPAVELDAPIAAAMPPTLTTALLNGATSSDTAPPTSAFGANTAPSSTLTPHPADLHAGQTSSNSALARGTAALGRRKNDWARPDTAVGSSAGPLAGDETFAVGVGGGADLTGGLSAELGEMAITDRLLNEDTAGGADATALFHRAGHSASDTGSPVRRGSGPIAIGGSERTTLHAHRATPTSSNKAAPAMLGSLEEGWPAVGAVGGFSPGLDESGTPLNTTFLSTLAEAPHATATDNSTPSSSRDFPPGRSAPAPTLVPAMVAAGTSRARLGEGDANEVHSSGEARGERAKRSSDGGEDVDTAEEEMGGPALGSTLGNGGGACHSKGKAKLDTKPLTMAGDSTHDLDLSGNGAVKLPLQMSTHASPSSASVGGTKSSGVRGQSRSRSRGGREPLQSDSDDQEAAPFQSYEHPPVPRTGPNLNASAYMSHQHHHSPSSQSGNGGHRLVSGDRGGNGDVVSSPTSPAASESKMARFKRRISHAM